MNAPVCFDCVYFVPEGSQHNDLIPRQWDECLEGECHRGVPRLGLMLKDRHGDSFRHFGEWPKVMAGDWCGEFKPREVEIALGSQD